jgi:polar amino acid transport system permease protein/cystine transport system permease protein
MNFWTVMVDRFPYFMSLLLEGAVMTVAVAAGALALALVLGLVIALFRMSRSRLLNGFAYVYTEFLRGTPALAQLFVIYFGLPDIGIELKPVEAAIVGLGINGSAYLSEVYRAGIQAIHRGQFEAAFSLGMTPIGSMRYIVLPQAVRMMLPPITNFSITLLKDTALVSVVAVPEIMFYARNLVTETFQSMHVYLLAAAIYLAMTIPMSRLVARLERTRRAWQ